MEITVYSNCGNCSHEPVCSIRIEYETTMQIMEKHDINEAFRVDCLCKYFEVAKAITR